MLSAQAEDVLRLMTYNVRNANGMDGICNYQRVANVINNARPDIVAIQELDSMTARSNRTDVLKELAERTQLHPCFAPAIDYDGGKYGIGILSKETPLRVQTFAFLLYTSMIRPADYAAFRQLMTEYGAVDGLTLVYRKPLP